MTYVYNKLITVHGINTGYSVGFDGRLKQKGFAQYDSMRNDKACVKPMISKRQFPLLLSFLRKRVRQYLLALHYVLKRYNRARKPVPLEAVCNFLKKHDIMITEDHLSELKLPTALIEVKGQKKIRFKPYIPKKERINILEAIEKEIKI